MNNQKKFDKFKTLRASECPSGTWMLEGSNRVIKHATTIGDSYVWIEEFNTFEECKMFCDLYFPGVKLLTLTFDQWYSNYYLGY